MDIQGLYDITAAADYLGISVGTLWYHLNRGNLQEDQQLSSGKLFTRETLDAFRKRKRKPGRPPTKR
jgi:hypothetical protein